LPEPFILDHIYKRSEIHDQFGGNRQSGICPSLKFPFIFIFSGKSGHQHGYKDGWDNPKVFSYTGEGQVGDMKFIKGNLALRDHVQSGKRVFLFEYERSGHVRYKSELEFYDADYFETHDTAKHLRTAIRFFFTRKGVHIPIENEVFARTNLIAGPRAQYQLNIPTITERKGLLTSRIGQGAYRKRIIHRWEYQYAVTGFKSLEVLIASHIVPWKDSTDTERLDVHNGILLSPTYDALFDRHLISFDNAGKIILSDAVEAQAYQKIGVTGKETIKGLSQFNLDYIDKHRELIRR
jgi:5-methylcytosine-specific restriction protein A